jgi:hypothetical protein
VRVVFAPAASGSRNSSLVVQYGAAGASQSIPLAGTGTGSETPPMVLTTYVGVYGDPVAAFNGRTAMLPLRLYLPAGFSTLASGYFQTQLAGTGNYSAQIYLKPNGSTYTLNMVDNLGNASQTITLTANGQTTPATLSMASLQVTATRLTLGTAAMPYELQLDLTIATSSTAFSYQVQLGANATTGYSTPWFATAATWGN